MTDHLEATIKNKVLFEGAVQKYGEKWSCNDSSDISDTEYINDTNDMIYKIYDIWSNCINDTNDTHETWLYYIIKTKWLHPVESMKPIILMITIITMMEMMEGTLDISRKQIVE